MKIIILVMSILVRFMHLSTTKFICRILLFFLPGTCMHISHFLLDHECASGSILQWWDCFIVLKEILYLQALSKGTHRWCVDFTTTCLKSHYQGEGSAHLCNFSCLPYLFPLSQYHCGNFSKCDITVNPLSTTARLILWQTEPSGSIPYCSFPLLYVWI